MYQCVLSLLLLPCVLLTQSAALRHTHGGREPAGHDLGLHFHTNSLAQCPHDHGHYHHDSDGHHGHHDDADGALESNKEPPSQPDPLPDHDSDAVFITGVDVVISERSAVKYELTASLFWAAIGLNPSTDVLANPMQQVMSLTHAPPSTGCACPLYIRHLALLV